MSSKRISYGHDEFQVIDVFEYPESTKTLVFVHGGAWISGHNSDFFELALRFLDYFKLQVILVDYRLTKKTRENQIIDPMHINDVGNAMKLICKSWDNLVCIGHSAGSNLLYNSITNEMPISLIVSVEGIYDFDDLLTRHPTYGEWFLFHAFPNRLKWSSRSSLGKELKVRQIIIHSVDDELVEFGHAEWFSSKSKVEMVRVEGHTHDGILESKDLMEIIKSKIL